MRNAGCGNLCIDGHMVRAAYVTHHTNQLPGGPCTGAGTGGTVSPGPRVSAMSSPIILLSTLVHGKHFTPVPYPTTQYRR